MDHIVSLTAIEPVTHDVKYFRFRKPAGFRFVPGQATDVSINKPEWKEEKRPFTFTCLEEDPYLEFTIKRYPDHHGVTDQLHQLKPGDELIIGDSWGAIEYKGHGCFIAGGAGITPFIAILRQLHKDRRLAGNQLIFSNKTAADIIYEKSLQEMLGSQAVFLLTQEKNAAYPSGYINEEFIKKSITDFQKHFYLCGPDQMILDVSAVLTKLGAKPDTVVFEK
jgi:glycine betaine catabolism B